MADKTTNFTLLQNVQAYFFSCNKFKFYKHLVIFKVLKQLFRGVNKISCSDSFWKFLERFCKDFEFTKKAVQIFCWKFYKHLRKWRAMLTRRPPVNLSFQKWYFQQSIICEIKTSTFNRLNKPFLHNFLFPFSQTLVLQELYKTNFPLSCKTSSLPSPALCALQTLLLSFRRRMRLVPSSSKYRNSTFSFKVSETHVGRSRQVRTKLPFLRKYNLYIRFLDARCSPFARIPLRRHFSFWQLSKNEHKCKESKTETQTAILKNWVSKPTKLEF